MQHCMPELWKCCEKANEAIRPFGVCGHAFADKLEFEAHLIESHKYRPDDTAAVAVKCHIHRNDRTRFWCGFCGELINVDERPGVVLNDRFTHIADHFTKQHKRIDDWVDVKSHQEKKNIPRHAKASKTQTPSDNLTNSLREINPNETQTATSEQIQILGECNELLHEGNLNKRKREQSIDESDDCNEAKSKKGRDASPNPDLFFWECVSDLISGVQAFY
jgi:hypothetical protein